MKGRKKCADGGKVGGKSPAAGFQGGFVPFGKKGKSDKKKKK